MLFYLFSFICHLFSLMRLGRERTTSATALEPDTNYALGLATQGHEFLEHLQAGSHQALYLNVPFL